MLTAFDKKVHALSQLLCDTASADREVLFASLLKTESSELNKLSLGMEFLELPGRSLIKQILLSKSLKEVRETYTEMLSGDDIFNETLCQIDQLICDQNQKESIQVLIHELADQFAPGISLRTFIQQFVQFSSSGINFQKAETCSIFHTLKSRKGMPVIICAIAVWVAKLRGLELRGINLPGHFILSGVTEAGETLYFDPASGDAQEKNEDAMRSLVNRYGYELRHEMLDPVSHDLVLVRILNNLYRIWSKQDTMLKMNLAGDMIEMLKARKA